MPLCDYHSTPSSKPTLQVWGCGREIAAETRLRSLETPAVQRRRGGPQNHAWLVAGARAPVKMEVALTTMSLLPWNIRLRVAGM